MVPPARSGGVVAPPGAAPLLDPDTEGLAETGDEALWAAGPLGPEAEQRAARVQFARRVIAFTGVLPLSPRRQPDPLQTGNPDGQRKDSAISRFTYKYTSIRTHTHTHNHTCVFCRQCA